MVMPEPVVAEAFMVAAEDSTAAAAVMVAAVTGNIPLDNYSAEE
jgi:hypothetical protein